MRIIEWLMQPVAIPRVTAWCAAAVFALSIAGFLLKVWPI